MSPRNRFYGIALLGSSILWSCAIFVHWRADKRVSARLSGKIAELSASIEEMRFRPVSVASSASAASTVEMSSVSPSVPVRFGPPFRVQGSGRLGDRWTYLDIRHVDGSRRRYYCRTEDGMRGLNRMLGEIDADAIDADYNLLWLGDARSSYSMQDRPGIPIVE